MRPKNAIFFRPVGFDAYIACICCGGVYSTQLVSVEDISHV